MNKINESEQDSQLNNLLNDAKFIEIKNNILVFAVKDKFTRETLIRNYFLIIKRQIAEIDDNIKMVSITVDISIDNNNPLDGNLLAESNAINSESDQKRNLETPKHRIGLPCLLAARQSLCMRNRTQLDQCNSFLSSQ